MIVVLHLITGLKTGGAETMLHKLVAASDRTRYRHIVVSMIAEGDLARDIRASGVPVHTLGMQRGAPGLLGIWRFLRLVWKESPDVLQTWLYHADLLGLMALLIRRVPVVWNIRGSTHPVQSSWVAKSCVRLSRMPAAAVVNSESGRAVHASLGYNPRQWVLIPNGFDLQKFHPDQQAYRSVRHELGLSAEALLIGLVARADPMKDHANFLEAAGQLARAEPSAHFLLVGEGMTRGDRFLNSLIANGQLDGQVHLMGLRADIPRLTAALDIASSSSSYGEGFPNVIGEAMACGIACVATDVGDTARIVGETGIVVAPRDPAALADGWRRMIEMGAEQRQRLGLAARARIQEHYGLDSVVRRYEDLYESLMEERQCAV